MRYFLIIAMLGISLLAVSLTPAQLQMAKAAGYSTEDINKVVSENDKNSVQDDTSKVQVVENNITKKNIQKQEPQSKLIREENEATKKELKKYGSQFFKNKNLVNPYSLPTPSNYLLNYGDKINVIIYGSIDEEFILKVKSNGHINIPKVGEVKVIGLNFDKAKALIKKRVQNAYPNVTNILVDISEFTPIQVTISGLVNAPGLYNLTSFSTIKDALLVSGGILEKGSYRDIILKRAGKKLKVFDLYKLINKGDDSQDVTLKNGDVIIINPLKKEIMLKGEVVNEAIYELKSKESFKDLISFASGITPQANTRALTLKRYEDNTIKVYTMSLKEFYQKTPKNGDEIEIAPLSIQSASLVRIIGNVTVDGEKELPENKSLATLFQRQLKLYGKEGFFKKNTNYSYAIKEDVRGNVESFKLNKVLQGEADLSLKAGDTITIYTLHDLNEKPYFYAKGLMVSEDRKKYDFVKGLQAKDLFNIVHLKHELMKDGKRVVLYPDRTKVQINRLENGKKVSLLIDVTHQGDFKIKKYDEIVFFDYATTHNSSQASINGQVFIPGKYDITDTTTLNELVKIAGGFTNKALLTKAEVARYKIVDNKRIRKILSIDLQTALDEQFAIFPDDEVTIFVIENWYDKKYIELKGEVKYPGRYSIAPGERLSSVIKRAGGFTKYAFVEGSVFTRESVRKLQKKRLQEALDRLKKKALQFGASANEAGETTADKQQVVQTVEQLEQEASATEPIGRISLQLYIDLERFANSSYDITLEDQDTLYIPTINDTVAVVGEVLNQNTFVFQNTLDAYEYIEKAGGVTDSADEDYIYIVKANGEAKRVTTNFFWGSSNEVFKGDTVVVPLKIDIISDIAFAKDITSILYQLAVTAASLKTVGAI